MKTEKSKLLNVTVEDAFAMGRVEGLKEAFREMEKLSIVDPFFAGWVKGRLSAIEELTKLPSIRSNNGI